MIFFETIFYFLSTLVLIRTLLEKDRFDVLIKSAIEHPYFKKTFVGLSALMLFLTFILSGLILFLAILKGKPIWLAMTFTSLLMISGINMFHKTVVLAEAFPLKKKTKGKKK